MPNADPPIARALISVSDKTGIEAFGRFLAERGVEILSTGGTAKALAAAGEIYSGTYEGWYSVRDEAFFAEKELTKGEGGKLA